MIPRRYKEVGLSATTSNEIASGIIKAVLVIAFFAACVGFMLSQCEATASREAERSAYGW